MSKAILLFSCYGRISYLGTLVLARVLCLKITYLGYFVGHEIPRYLYYQKHKHMKIHNELTILIASAPRTTCNDLMTVSTDGDLRGLVQARISFLDNIQKEAQKIIYTQTPPGMVDSWQLRDWWYENFQTLNICDIDFSAISEGKKQEWYAYANK